MPSFLVRADMSERLKKREWTIIPTKETLQVILSMAEFNKTANLHERWHCLLVSSSPSYTCFSVLHLFRNYPRKNTSTTLSPSTFSSAAAILRCTSIAAGA